MTTREFIAKTYGTEATRDRQCSSVFTDNNGNVYSYGYHYPLLFKVAGHNFVNTTGYSTTTAKHINWAWSAVDYNATAIELNRDDARVMSNTYMSEQQKLNTLELAALRMVERAQAECDSKKRKDTQVYQWLCDKLGRADASLIAVRNLQGKGWAA